MEYNYHLPKAQTFDGGDLRVAVAPSCPWPLPEELPGDGPWMYARIDAGGSGLILASHARFLYGLYAIVKERIVAGEGESLEDGLVIRPPFHWITGREDQHMLRLGYLKKRKDPVTLADVEASFREAARLGCTHVVVNEPAERTPHETGPDGEIYYRFYAYALDIDQYVETKLNKGTYPPELLNGNLALLKKLSGLAVKYGLTPGLYSANPRSVPESLLAKIPVPPRRTDRPHVSFLRTAIYADARPSGRSMALRRTDAESAQGSA